VSRSARARLYGRLVARGAAIRKKGRGTYMRVGSKTSDAARWRHEMYRGTAQLRRGPSEVLTARIRATTPEEERRLLSSFLSFDGRHSDDQAARITIRFA
jgi:hypothetical protein